MTVTVDAREKWNDPGLDVAAGQSYRFEAAGVWKDASIQCGPDGYVSPNFILRLAEGLRRAPKANWFALIGTTGRDEKSAFVIGKATTRAFASSGALYFFANDVSFKYGNNSGAVQLRMTRIA